MSIKFKSLELVSVTLSFNTNILNLQLEKDEQKVTTVLSFFWFEYMGSLEREEDRTGFRQQHLKQTGGRKTNKNRQHLKNRARQFFAYSSFWL